MNISTIAWLAPIVLLLVIGFRIYNRKKPRSVQSQSRNVAITPGKVVTTLLFMLVVLVFVWITFFKFHENCPTTLSPELLDKMVIHGNDYAAGILKNKKFVWDVEDQTYNNKFIQYNDFNYCLFADPQKPYLEWKQLIERITIDSAYPGSLLYFIANMEKDEEFLSYLKKIGGDSLIDERYVRNEYFLGDRPAIKYRHSVFVDWSYIRKDEACLIEIFSSDSLRLKPDSILRKQKISSL